MVRLLSPLKLFAAAVFAAALIFGLAEAPRAKAADDRLQFTATTLSGAPFNGASLQGKPAVLWFWAPRCPFCNAEAPASARWRPPTRRSLSSALRPARMLVRCRTLFLRSTCELHEPQRRRRFDLGPLQRPLAAGLIAFHRADGSSTSSSAHPTAATPCQD